MQAIAAESGIETAFVLPPRTSEATLRLRYFVPQHEMTMCVHGTIGALAALTLEEALAPGPLKVETSIGVLGADVQAEAHQARVAVQQLPPTFGPILAPSSEVVLALGLSADALDTRMGPLQSVSASRSKLMVPVVNAAALDAMSPRWEEMWQLCERLQVTGVYAFTRCTRAPGWHIDARQFPLRAGFPEDAATGVAAAALAGYLVVHAVFGETRRGGVTFRIAQGDAMGRPSLIEAEATMHEGVIASARVWGRAFIQETGDQSVERAPDAPVFAARGHSVAEVKR